MKRRKVMRGWMGGGGDDIFVASGMQSNTDGPLRLKNKVDKYTTFVPSANRVGPFTAD